MSLNDEFAKYFMAAYESANKSVPSAEDLIGVGGWMVQAMYFSMGKRHDYRQALRQVNARVIILHGENDLQSQEASQVYSALFPNSEFRVIKRAGHFSFDEQPEEFYLAVAKFLNGIN